ncbi:MAG: baseplate J/gp47 family protein [Peptoniphilus lacydonensis]|nr:baseplate J/gp47 family protein [Peptoniphilus lacydonensis]
MLYDMSEKAKALFGSDVNVSGHSVLGIIIRIVAWFLSISHELTERVYYSGFISQATGVSLDRLGANNGIYRNPATVAVVELEFSGKAGYVINEGVCFSTENKIMFQMIDVVKIDDSGFGKGHAISLEKNASSNVPANTITVQVEPTEEIISVNNPARAEGGAERETDKAYRDRIGISVRGNPGPPINGILTALLEVSGVRTASVVENKTMKTDSYGNPPKSVHVHILGGVKEDIGQAIFKSVAAGIDTVGAEEVEVKDLGGFSHIVKFDYAKAVPIFVNISIQVDSKFEESGTEKLKTVVNNYINNLTMGEVVRFSYIYPLVYQIPGIVVADVKIGLSAEATEAKDIKLKPDESAECIPENVVITNVEKT